MEWTKAGHHTSTMKMSLLIEAGAVETLQVYFLQARTPLTAAQLSDLTSSGRLTFSCFSASCQEKAPVTASYSTR